MALKAKEIAGILGISQATLSLVVNNKPGISEKTRNRVIQELRDRGFDYLLSDQTRKDMEPAGEMRSIGFIIYTVAGDLLGYNSFFQFIMEGLESRARKHGYNICFVTVRKENIQYDIQHIKNAGYCGCAIFATEMHEDDIVHFEGLGIPLVLLDNYFNTYSLNSVKLNNQQGTYLAVRNLIEHGHKKIGYLRSGLNINSFEERYASALNAMRGFGIDDPAQYTYTIGYRTEDAAKGMKKLLDEGVPLPTAFLADNDIVAAGAMLACHEAGVKIPEELSFIGFDDRPECILCSPQLSTIRISRQYFGAEAIEVLIRMLNGETNIQMKIEIGTEMVERGSVSDLAQGEK